MVFFEVMQQALALNIGFFIDFALENLFWFFIFYSLMYYFMGGKKTLYFALLFAAIMWAWVDLANISGLYWTIGSFLLIYYILKLATVAIIESTPILRKYTVIISTLQFYVLFLIFQFFIK